LKIRPLLLLSLRAVLGAVFAVSGFQKLVSPYQNFAAVIEKFEILKGPSVTLLAQTLPWLELAAGIFLILGFWENISLVVLWGMNTLFLGVLGSALARSLPIDSCGCFGEAVTLSLPKILALDAGLWVLFLVYFFGSRRWKVPGLDQKFSAHAAK
jgi:uncharacterized membrane protein YphA (DoxX/SURF4 family)